MTFFEITPVGALVNALEAAAESDLKSPKRQITALPKRDTGRVSLEGLVNQARTLVASLERKEASTS